MGALIGLTVDPPYREGVIGYVVELIEAAQLLAGFPLDETIEPSPIFRP